MQFSPTVYSEDEGFIFFVELFLSFLSFFFNTPIHIVQDLNLLAAL